MSDHLLHDESINCLNRNSRLDALNDEPVSSTAGPEEATSAEQRSDGVQTALMTIKAEYRTVIVLKHFLDCSYVEISQILEIPEKRVKSRLYEGRQLLKNALCGSGLHR